MKAELPFMIVFLVAISCQSPSVDYSERIVAAVEQQVNAYPASTLMDVYKSFYQDECGPGHLLEDTAAAREYLFYELSEMKSRGRHSAEPCGIGKKFVRVPMDLVKDSLIDAEIFFNAFLESAKSFSAPDAGQWKKQWDGILEVVERMDLNLPGFEADKRQLEDLLNQGKPVVHHSQAYTDSYDPHYRIMTVERWEELVRGRR
jgi:hypothetical protein